MANVSRLEWWTGADAAVVRPIAGDWTICSGEPGGPDVFRVHAAASEPTPDDGPALWRRATGPARVETLRGGVLLVVTDIHDNGDLTTRTAPAADADLLRVHRDAVAAALATRAAAAARALASLSDDAVHAALHAFATARCAEV